VPTTWDETKVPVAIPGERVTVARRKGDEWWVGTINSGVAREVSLSLSWLPAGKYEADIYRDEGVNPNGLVRESREVNAGDSVVLKLAPGGGQVMRLRKVLNF
jgi:alpha-glucosidase